MTSEQRCLPSTKDLDVYGSALKFSTLVARFSNVPNIRLRMPDMQQFFYIINTFILLFHSLIMLL